MPSATPPRQAPAYRRIAADFRGRILGGEWAPNTRLPTEQELCDRLGVSRITIRQALQLLSEERLLFRRQGSGSYVSPRPTRRIPLLQAGFTRSVSRHAPELRRRVLAFGRRRATPDVAEDLALPADCRVVYARRVDLLGDRPVAYDDVYLPEPFGDRLDRDDVAQVSFSPRWRQVQRLAIARLHQRVEAVAATAAQARILAVRRGAPLLKTVEISVERGGKPAGLFITHYRGQTFSLASTCQITEDPD